MGLELLSIQYTLEKLLVSMRLNQCFFLYKKEKKVVVLTLPLHT